MCIVCKASQLAKVQMEMVDTLAMSIDQCLRIINRVQSTGFVLNDIELESLRISKALLAGHAQEPVAPCPVGFPADVWAQMPAEVQGLLRKAVADGATLTTVTAEELIADAAQASKSTKH